MQRLEEDVLVVERDRSEILLEVIESMTRAPSIDAALHNLAELALRAAGGDRCAIFVRDRRNGDRLVPAAAATRIGDPADQWQRFRDMDAVDVGEHFERRLLLQTEEIIAIEDAASSPIIPQRWHREWGSLSAVLAPLRIDGEGFGVLGIDHVRQRHRFTTGEIELLRGIASAASLALRDAELIQQVRKQALLEQQLTECIGLLLAGGSTREVLGSLADAFHLLLPDSSFSINLVAADRTSFRPMAWRGARPLRDVFEFGELPPLDIAMIRDAWKEDPHRPITIDDLSLYRSWRDLVPEGLNVAMIVPLTDSTGVVGWIAAGRAGAPFSEEEVRVARIFADHAAIAVSQAALRDSSQARLRVIDALFLLGERAGRLSDPRGLVKALNHELQDSVGLRCVRLAVDSALYAQGVRLPLVNSAERTLIQGWRADPRPVVEDKTLAVPVRIRDRAVGVLWLEASTTPDPLMLSLAGAIAGAIGEVAFKARLRRKSERRAVELALASERERIAQDLHDTVGQIFYSLGLRLHDAAQQTDDEALRETLLTLRGHASAGMHEVRTSVYAQSVLRTDRSGLAASVREIAKRFSLATGVQTDVRVDGTLGRIPAEIARALTRVVHEIFVNVERHARAQIVTVRLARTNDGVSLVVRDDGVGIAHRGEIGWKEAANFGMRSMEKTIRMLGGRFDAQAALPVGLELRITVPLKQGDS